MSDFEAFKKNMSLLKSFYTIDKNAADPNYEKEGISQNLIGEDGTHDSLMNNIKRKLEREVEYQYGYCSYYGARILSCCSCCCKNSCASQRLKRLELHEQGV
jgi:hypothetical protein